MQVIAWEGTTANRFLGITPFHRYGNTSILGARKPRLGVFWTINSLVLLLFKPSYSPHVKKKKWNIAFQSWRSGNYREERTSLATSLPAAFRRTSGIRLPRRKLQGGGRRGSGADPPLRRNSHSGGWACACPDSGILRELDHLSHPPNRTPAPASLLTEVAELRRLSSFRSSKSSISEADDVTSWIQASPPRS